MNRQCYVNEVNGWVDYGAVSFAEAAILEAKEWSTDLVKVQVRDEAEPEAVCTMVVRRQKGVTYLVDNLIDAPPEVTAYDQFQESIRSHVRNGWKIYYDPATMFVGADNPKGGRMSICEVKVCDRSGLDPHALGMMIADRMNEIGMQPE
jgi:hypothetical protein